MAGFVVATALSIPSAPAECELEFVFVVTQARGQGTGHTLVRDCVGMGRRSGRGGDPA